MPAKTRKTQGPQKVEQKAEKKPVKVEEEEPEDEEIEFDIDDQEEGEPEIQEEEDDEAPEKDEAAEEDEGEEIAVEEEEEPEEEEEIAPPVKPVKTTKVKKTAVKKTATKKKPAPKKQVTKKQSAKQAVKQSAKQATKSDKKKKAEPSPKKGRKQLTVEDLVEELNEAKKLLDQEIETLQGNKSRVRLRGVRNLQRIRKKVVGVRDSIPRISKSKKRARANGSSGFNKAKIPSKELRAFLGLGKDEFVSRAEATRALCVYVKVDEKKGERPDFKKWEHLNPGGQRNLQDQDDLTRIIPDEKLSKLLHYEQYKKDVDSGKYQQRKKKEDGTYEKVVLTDNNLYYKVIQRLLNQHLLDNN